MFFEDAELVSKELELTLTGKNAAWRSAHRCAASRTMRWRGYLNKLVANGHKVAICEQVEDPKLAKGLVRREVIRIVTPGTNLDMQALDDPRTIILCASCIWQTATAYPLRTSQPETTMSPRWIRSGSFS